jgi:hypothetical protein
MLDSWIVGFGIEYSDGGAATKLDALARKAQTLDPLVQSITASFKAATAATNDFSSAATAATASHKDLDAILRRTARAGTSVASSMRAAADSYNYAATSADRFSESQFSKDLRFNRIMQSSFGGGRGGTATHMATGDMFPGGVRRGAFGRFGDVGGGFGGLGGGGRGTGGGGRGSGGGSAGGGPLGSLPEFAGPLGWAGHQGMKWGMHGAEAGAGLALDAFYEASKLQAILATTQNLTGATDAQMEGIKGLAYDVGSKTNMSVSNTADMFREIVRSSQGTMSLDAMTSLLTPMAKMQVVLGTTRGMSPKETTDTTMSLVHLFRQYKPGGIPNMMDTVVRMMELSQSPPDQLLRQMTIFEPALKNLKVPDADAATLAITMSRFGMMRGRGGSSLQDLVLQALGPLQMTQHAQNGKAGLMKQMGILDAHGNSKYFTDKGGDIFGFLDALEKYENKVGSTKATGAFNSVFLKQGGRLADMFGDPTLMGILNSTRATMNQPSLGLESSFEKIMGKAFQASKHAWANFQSMMTEVGERELPGFTKGLNDLGDAFHNAQAWMHQHGDTMLSIQNAITNDIKGTEKWIVSHQSDWDRLGKDAKNAFDDLNRLGPVLQVIGDSALNIENIVGAPGRGLHALEDWLNQHAPGTDRSSLPDGYIDPSTGNWVPNLTNASGMPPVGAGLNLPKPVKVEHHVMFEVRGADKVGAHEVRKAVEQVIFEDILSGGLQGKRSGDIKTSPKHASQTVTPHT